VPRKLSTAGHDRSAAAAATAASGQPVVTAEHILEVVAEATGIPRALLTGIPTDTAGTTGPGPAFSASAQAAALQELSSIHSVLTSAVLGQDAAAAAVIGALRLSRLGLQHHSSALPSPLQDSSPSAPAVALQQQQARLSLSLLLSGPNGVGKSTMARLLAECLLPGEPQALLHLSCGELSERHSISRLVGAPPGYVGESWSHY
jgi:ATP-dependent Clp protease ATP-binding subunit ClpA